jgi:hypothetical protein
MGVSHIHKGTMSGDRIRPKNLVCKPFEKCQRRHAKWDKILILNEPPLYCSFANICQNQCLSRIFSLNMHDLHYLRGQSCTVLFAKSSESFKNQTADLRICS